MFLLSGVEPLSFYFLNGFLNFNIVFIMALVSLPFVVSIHCILTWVSLCLKMCVSSVRRVLYVYWLPLSVKSDTLNFGDVDFAQCKCTSTVSIGINVLEYLHNVINYCEFRFSHHGCAVCSIRVNIRLHYLSFFEINTCTIQKRNTTKIKHNKPICVFSGIPAWLCMSSMYIWILIFFTRPHKVRVCLNL